MESVKIESFKFNKESGSIEVVFREISNTILCSYPPINSPDKIWKEIYEVVEGSLKMTNKIEGTHTPKTYISEKITFNAN